MKGEVAKYSSECANSMIGLVSTVQDKVKCFLGIQKGDFPRDEKIWSTSQLSYRVPGLKRETTLWSALNEHALVNIVTTTLILFSSPIAS